MDNDNNQGYNPDQFYDPSQINPNQNDLGQLNQGQFNQNQINQNHAETSHKTVVSCIEVTALRYSSKK